MDPNLRQSVEQYNQIDWNSLTRADSFAEGKNFNAQKKLFDQIKKSFGLIFENIENLSETLPSEEMNHIKSFVDQFIQLRNRINGYSDTNRHQEMTDDIKRTCFNIQEKLTKYLEYINPSDVKEKIKKELDELVKVKSEVEKAVKDRLSVLDQGIEKVNEGKREISGVEVAKFYEDQAARHRNSAEGNGKKLFGKFSIPRGWLASRTIYNGIIILMIIVITVSYLWTFNVMDNHDDWKMLWNVRLGILSVALLSIFYTGLYFATKNYEREKDLEYKNKVRSNIANTWLMFSAGQNEEVRDTVAKEAAKTLFSDIAMSEKKKASSNGNISISIPQNIGKAINHDQQ